MRNVTLAYMVEHEDEVRHQSGTQRAKHEARRYLAWFLWSTWVDITYIAIRNACNHACTLADLTHHIKVKTG